MRDSNYGFKAIEHRYNVLGGKPIKISDNSKLDLSRLLIEKYGRNFASHPRLESLIEQNEISKKDFLTGAEEALAFEDKEYIKLSRSSASKVDIFANILTNEFNSNLQTYSTKRQMFGTSVRSYIYRFKTRLLGKIIIWLFLTIGTFIIGYLINLLHG